MPLAVQHHLSHLVDLWLLSNQLVLGDLQRRYLLWVQQFLEALYHPDHLWVPGLRLIQLVPVVQLLLVDRRHLFRLVDP